MAPRAWPPGLNTGPLPIARFCHGCGNILEFKWQIVSYRPDTGSAVKRGYWTCKDPNAVPMRDQTHAIYWADNPPSGYQFPPIPVENQIDDDWDHRKAYE